MKIAIYGKRFRDNFNDTIALLFYLLESNDFEIIVHKAFYDFLLTEVNVKPKIDGLFETHEDITDDVKFMMSIGGDGTFLEAISFVRRRSIPIVGINTGRLGFLAYVSEDEIPLVIEAMQEGDYEVEQRSLLELNSNERLFGDFNYGLNEVTVLKKDSSSMITIHVYIENEFLNSYWADGLIISTPTGSTAYSLSAGGPIVAPNSQNFVITPLAPHNLTVRPLIVPDNKSITLKVDGRCDSFLTAIDYRSASYSGNAELLIQKADFTISIFRLKHHNFFSTLRNRLMWGLDKRN